MICYRRVVACESWHFGYDGNWTESRKIRRCQNRGSHEMLVSATCERMSGIQKLITAHSSTLSLNNNAILTNETN